MAAGGPGDHPITDIVNFKLDVYNTECDKLVLQISKYVSINSLYEMFEWPDNYLITKKQLKILETTLKEKLRLLKNEAQVNGWGIK